tara:strand:+ start:481 stop:1026 length:546 start_codon:yes stop_codon:yes gene_type:complete
MVRVRGQLDAPLLDVGAVREDYWERKEILLPSLSRLYKPKGWRRFFYKTQAPKIVLRRLTQSDWQEIDNRNYVLQAEIEKALPEFTPLINKYIKGQELSESEYNRLDKFSVKMRPINYTMLQFIIDEPKMSYEDVKFMMEILDNNDMDTLLSYVSIMTSEKAIVAKHIFDKKTKEAEMLVR